MAPRPNSDIESRCAIRRRVAAGGSARAEVRGSLAARDGARSLGNRGRSTGSAGFTLIEVLVSISIIALLLALLIPVLGSARAGARAAVCSSRLGQLGKGWQMYADANKDIVVPGRLPEAPGGFDNPRNWHDVGNGDKYRPNWAAMLAPSLGAFPFDAPSTRDERQDFDSDVFLCPQVADWRDERNYPFGYNYQFLGNARWTNGFPRKYPVYQFSLRVPSGTVMAADSMGTAGGFSTRERLGYDDDLIAPPQEMMGNVGWALDPPRLTADSDHGDGRPGSRRSSVDPRHRGRANVVFCDGHVEAMTDEQLGYRRHAGGRYVDLDPPEGPPPTNKLFSQTGRDDDPPPSRD